MSSRYLMLMAAIPVCYFAGYAYREMHDPDQTASTLHRNPQSLSDSLLESRLQTLQDSKRKVLHQLAELESHRDKLKSTNGRDTDLPGRLCTGHYGFGLELCTTAGSITPIEVKADIVVSTADRTRRLGNQGFKADFNQENTLYGVSNILLAKTMAQEPSVLFEARCYVSKTPSLLEMFWQDPYVSNVVILSSNGSFAPILVNGSIVQRALPKIKEVITISAPADELTADHHHQLYHAQSGPAMDPTSPQQQLQQTGTPLSAASPNEDDCLVDLSESTVSFVAVSPPSEPIENDGEELLIGEPIQERRQPAHNRKTRRKRQKQNKTDPEGLMAAGSSSGFGEEDEEEGAPSPSPSSSSSSTTTSSSSLLLLSARFSDTAATSSEPNTPKPSPAVLRSSPNHSTAKNEDPALALWASARVGREVWLWPDEEDLPASACESIMRWVYFDTTTWTPPLEHFNALYAFLARLSNSTLLQAFVMAQRRAIEHHPSPLTLVAATTYNDGPARRLLRPVLVASIQKRWSSASTATVLASMLKGDPWNVVLDVIQALPPPQG
ncbi:hypothetical protein BGZ70_006208 [Mortierella alpina]|uniref:Uncharacterized protein n=1 Tax=Mortierella alpina TaxID=64518 RepID=A0A9P6JBI9_MORAP|nr:hypothetical protein BGZ70_006208 [Mortierella alpina]